MITRTLNVKKCPQCDGGGKANLLKAHPTDCLRCKGTGIVSTLRTLTCDMEKDCPEQVAMIDTAGFVYCQSHGLDRRSWEPCRKLRGWELRRLEKGNPLTRY